ncbi:SAF domain-containing protein [Magnetospirillum sp. UT-4]|uniref:SAF domain-containing protein n=1 Tax=Magnetospirillum sp. UT-4 TaxID=2681467 RepID=UPI0013826239|nr:SAF domain-containing protein [Magnetospirillum sp. UT-4]CAA7613598.1 Homoserine dehydrogenase [Magnetospirillum sp. UT-4]
MSATSLLTAREPVRVGLAGAGRLATMFLAQARHSPGIHVAAVADPDPERGPTALALAQWPPVKAVARSLADALASGGTWVTTDAAALTESARLDVLIEAGRSPAAGILTALAAIDRGIHVVMANIGADALAGPALAARAAARGVVYSLAYGDQPALICELVEWARTCGFEVAAAGRGSRWLPGCQAVTPDTVWTHFGRDASEAKAADLHSDFYTALLDGTHAALELAAVANACLLAPPSAGLSFPPCGSHDLARVLRPSWDGGRLESAGMVEAVSTLERDGRRVFADLENGVFVTFRAQSDFAARSLPELGVPTDGGAYGARWRQHHLLGFELPVSVAEVALNRRPTGCPRAFVADVATVAKRDLDAGTELDGAGGATVWGRLLPAEASLAQQALPIGLAAGLRLLRPVAAGQVVTRADVALDDSDPVVAFRTAMEQGST